LENTKRTIEQLLYILSEETKQLKAGELRNLGVITTEKTRYTALLEAQINDLGQQAKNKVLGQQLAKLQRRTQENALILRSVINGVKSARVRLKNLKHKNANVGAYDQRGTGLVIGEDQITQQIKI